MLSRFFLAALVLGFSLPAAAHYSIDGTVLIRNLNRDFLDPAEALLSLPKDGEENIYLSVGNRTYTTNKSRIYTRSDRRVFYIVFEANSGSEEPHQDPNEGDNRTGNSVAKGSQVPSFANGAHRVVFKGTYARGNNLAIYYGDIFMQSRGRNKKSSIDDIVGSLEKADAQVRFGYKYIGAFEFTSEIEGVEGN